MKPRAERFAAWKARPGRQALVRLLEASQDRVFAVCLDVLRHRHDAEEAAQETLLEIVLGIDAVRDADHYESWLLTVARRTALDRKKSSRRRRERELQVAGQNSNGHPAYEGLHDAIAKLDEDDRALLLERYFDRTTLEEMGRRRGLSDVGVRKRIEKAHDKLKRMLGCLFGIGVTAMKTKAAAALAVVLIPLLLLGGGVWVASGRMGSRPVVESPAGKKGSEKIAAFLSEAKSAPVAKTPEPIAVSKPPIDRAQIRAQIIASLERMRYVGGRSWQCKELWPEASTEEEGRALQREKVALDKESGELYRILCDLAAQDPPTIVDLVKNGGDIPWRLSLAGLIAPEVDAEISTEDAPSGPLLAELLTLALGDAEDRVHIAAFAGKLTRANRDLGKMLITMMDDSDLNVRVHSAMSLATLSEWGLLRQFLTEQIPGLRQAALRDDAMNDHHTRGCALRVLASLGVDEADDFVLQQFESLESRHDFDRITAVLWAAPRIVPRHEARLVMAILRALDLPFQEHIHPALLGVAQHLSKEARETVSRAAGLRTPVYGVPPQSPRMAMPRGRPRPTYRSFTGVNRRSDHREGASQRRVGP
jgi:RNA polymerase sigma factor (sigma-70 family)